MPSMPIVPLAGITPREGWVVIQPDAFKSAVNLIIPDVAKDSVMDPTGIVIAAGPKQNHEQLELVPGDTVLVSRWMGHDVEVQGQKAILMARDHVLAIVKKATIHAITQ